MFTAALHTNERRLDSMALGILFICTATDRPVNRVFATRKVKQRHPGRDLQQR